MGRAVRRLPAPPRRYRFVLTPLADAMFQLLIFFMLASSLTPYSIMTLRSSPDAVAEGAAGAASAGEATVAAALPPETVLWNIHPEAIVIAGQIFDPEDLPDLVATLGTDAVPADLTLVIREGARVQDVATVMEALSDANVGSVQIAPEAI